MQGTRKVLADLGCGSGLSAAALRQAGHSVVGSDITRSMLQLAARHEGYAGALVLADFGQGMPLRQACLDGAISVSSVQVGGWAVSPGDRAGVGGKGQWPSSMRLCLHTTKKNVQTITR